MSRNSRKQNKTRSVNTEIWILAVLIAALVSVSVWFGLSLHSRFNDYSNVISDVQNDITEIQKEINNINTGVIQGEVSETEINLEFLKEQMRSHQEFVENERSFLLWMIGFIFTAGGVLIGFFGFKSRQEVEAILDRKYRFRVDSLVDEMLTNAVGGNENRQFLESAIEKERNAQLKKVYFIKQKDSDKLDEVLDWTKELHGGIVKSTSPKIAEASPSLFSRLKEDQKFLEYSIFIYEVSGKEFNEKEKPEKNNYDDGHPLEYKLLSDFCVVNDKQCILVCRPGNQITASIINEMHATTVNFISKLRETLFALLYM